jgi:hypothetical protein
LHRRASLVRQWPMVPNVEEAVRQRQSIGRQALKRRYGAAAESSAACAAVRVGVDPGALVLPSVIMRAASLPLTRFARSIGTLVVGRPSLAFTSTYILTVHQRIN